MELKIGKQRTGHSIDSELFKYMSVNYCFEEDELYISATENHCITFANLRDLARKYHLPYCIFFGRLMQVKKLVETQNQLLYGSLDSKYIVGTRGESININRIRYIILDLVGKQAVYKKYGYNERQSKTFGYLKSSWNAEDSAAYVIKKLKIDMEFLRSSGLNKGQALRYLRNVLEDNHIHVSIEAPNFMPQKVPRDLNFSGVYIKDNYNPTMFVANEILKYPEEGSGRKIYTIVYLLVSMFRGVSYAVSIDTKSYSVDSSKNKKHKEIHAITNEILLPQVEMRKYYISTFDDIEKIAKIYKVTNRATIERLNKLGMLGENYQVYVEESKKRFNDFVRKKKEAEANRDKDSSGPNKKIMIQYYQGGFLDFVKNNVPYSEQKILYKKHVSFGRLGVKPGDI